MIGVEGIMGKRFGDVVGEVDGYFDFIFGFCEFV